MKITKAILSSGEELKFGSFNVFIGGNGVGKTTALTEIFCKTTDLPISRFSWIDRLEYSSTNFEEDLDLFKNSLQSKRDQGGLYYYSRSSKDMNENVDLSDNVRFSRGEIDEVVKKTEDEFFSASKTRRPFISFCGCESRLNLQNEVGLSGLSQPAQEALNVLHRDNALFKSIDEIIHQRFNIHLALLSHTKNQLHLGVSKRKAPKFNEQANSLQEEYERIEQWRISNVTPITESGHGRRSMIRLLTSLMDPINQIILIDEPEMHLYPNQKRWLGKQLVDFANNQKKQVFLVTHDPMILQGILDSNTTTDIFRVERAEGTQGKIKASPIERLVDMNATRSQDQFLQGLFYQRAIVVEGASDRFFYQTLIDGYTETSDKDLGFIASSGTGNIIQLSKIIIKLNLKASLILDFDVLMDSVLITKIYGLFGGDAKIIKKIDELVMNSPQIKKESIPKKKQKAMHRLRKEIGKKGINHKLVKRNIKVFQKAMSELEKKGIFLVPNGSLESWAPNLTDKYRFADDAPPIIQSDSKLKIKFDKFAKKVLKNVDIRLS